MGRHTEGPWEVRKAWDGEGYEVFRPRKVAVGVPTELLTVQKRADADLIAAAPSLLAALQKMVRDHDERANAGFGTLVEIAHARVAIAKATQS